MPSLAIPNPPRRFRRRLLAVLFIVGFLPALAWAAVDAAVVRRLLSISLTPLGAALETLDAQCTAPGAKVALRQAQVDLVQAELARKSLVRMAPFGLAAVVALVALLLVFGSAQVSRSLSSPVELLTAGMWNLARGDFSHRVPAQASQSDELQFLISQFNRMAGELQTQRSRLEVTEKLAAWQDVARMLAHELKNPLTAMKMSLARLTRGRAPTESVDTGKLTESLAILEQEIEVLLRMTQSFSTFAKLPPPTLRPIELSSLLEETCELYRAEFHGDGEVRIEADPDQLRRAFGNLVKNANEASNPDDGPVRVELQSR